MLHTLNFIALNKVNAQYYYTYYVYEKFMSANLIIVNNFFVEHIRTLVNPIIKVMLMTDRRNFL